MQEADALEVSLGEALGDLGDLHQLFLILVLRLGLG